MQTIFGTSSLISSTISPQRNHPSPYWFPSERNGLAKAAIFSISMGAEKRLLCFSAFAAGSRSLRRMRTPTLEITDLMKGASNSLCLKSISYMNILKKSKKSGTVTSAPSCSRRFTRWLLAKGIYFTKISPTMPTLGLRRASSTGSSSKFLTIPRQTSP